MSAEARFEGLEEIVIAGSRDRDRVIAIVCGVLALAVVVVLLASPAEPRTALYAAGVLAVLAWAALGPVWRLRDRRPLIHADVEGLRFHPSFLTPPLSWSRVGTVAIASDAAPWGQGSSYLRFRLDDRRLSLDWPFWSDRLKLRLAELDLGDQEAKMLLRQFRRLRSQARIRSRDPGVAD